MRPWKIVTHLTVGVAISPRVEPPKEGIDFLRGEKDSAPIVTKKQKKSMEKLYSKLPSGIGEGCDIIFAKRASNIHGVMDG